MINSLESAVRDGVTGLYELGAYTFRDATRSARLFAFDLTERHDGRPDLVSYDIYGDTEQVDVICDINGIINPHSMSEGTTLILCEQEDIELFILRPDETESLRNALINNMKGTKKDRGRAKYIERTAGVELAASFMLPNGQTAVREEGGRIKIYPV